MPGDNEERDGRQDCEYYQMGQRDFRDRAIKTLVRLGFRGFEEHVRALEIECICPKSEP